jgi:DNA-binding MarR family transcriptional regulator/GNAT superfamily N-acetyltransferase
MTAGMVEEVRRFSRVVTAHVGALDDHYLGLGRPLGEARLLWEVGADGCELRALRGRLELDSGYLSRLLRSLEGAGLVTVAEHAADRRARVVRLTAAGLAERATLDARAHERALALLQPLAEAERKDLVAAMRQVQRLLTAAAVQIAPVDPEHPDARRCLRAYVTELDAMSDTGYDPTAGATAEPHEVRPPAGLFLLARLHGEAVGCGALKHRPGAPTELKRMWVSPSVRGLGVGARLLRELETRAREHGSGTVRLETSDRLVTAIGMYRRAGYVEVPPFNAEPFADHWFEKRL